MTTHCRVLWAMSKSAWMAGRATFTMAMSSTTMNWAAQVRAKIRPVRAPAGCIGLLLVVSPCQTNGALRTRQFIRVRASDLLLAS